MNTWDERELVTIFRRYGEERYAVSIARAIVRRRSERPFTRTGELVDTIKLGDPDTRAIRRGASGEARLPGASHRCERRARPARAALPAALETLRPGGRLAVISFHSLEDRIVKRFIAEQAKGCTCPPDFPVCVCGKEPTLRPLTRKPVRPGKQETDVNPRAASARLRAAVRA